MTIRSAWTIASTSSCRQHSRAYATDGERWETAGWQSAYPIQGPLSQVSDGVHDRLCGVVQATLTYGAASGAVGVEFLTPAIIAEIGRADLQDGLGSPSSPELFRRVGNRVSGIGLAGRRRRGIFWVDGAMRKSEK